jgi:hypothetical protein
MATAQATTDHDQIREWVESRGGHPSRVKRTGTRKDPGVLRIDFPGFSGEDTLEEIEWDEFFEWFDRDKLALLLSDEEGNRFNKFVSRGTAKSSSRRAAKSSSGKKAASSKKTAGSTKKASSSTKKASGSTKKASSSTTKKKAGSSTKKASASTKKASTSKKATTTKKASSSTKKASTSTKKTSATKKASASSSKTGRLGGSKTSSKTTQKRTATRSTSSNTTTDHDEIRNWVEARGGFPAHVRQTGRKRGDLGVLRIDYPGYSGKDTLERVDWEDWFDAFERNKLAFLYQDKRSSRFSKLVNR